MRNVDGFQISRGQVSSEFIQIKIPKKKPQKKAVQTRIASYLFCVQNCKCETMYAQPISNKQSSKPHPKHHNVIDIVILRSRKINATPQIFAGACDVSKRPQIFHRFGP